MYLAIEQTFFNPLPLSVKKEGPKAARVEMVDDGDEQSLVELEGGWELLLQLPHAVHPLDEHRRAVRVRVTLVAVADALREYKVRAIIVCLCAIIIFIYNA